MPKQRLKTQSRRMTTKKACKIRKKVKEHRKKANKAKKHKTNQAPSRHTASDDKDVPMDMPFTEQVLREAETQKRTNIEERKRVNKDRQKSRDKEQNKRRDWTKLERIDELVERARTPGLLYLPRGLYPTKWRNPEQNPDVIIKKEIKESRVVTEVPQTKSFFKDYKKVVEVSDIIIEVLDARDPLGSRCKELEATVQTAGPQKRLVLLLNKIDLVPRSNVEEWLKYLRNEYPTIPFKASTQNQKRHLAQVKGSVKSLPEKMLKNRGCLGSEKLKQLLGNYCRNKNIKTRITVGIVGFPNTGKSSVINSLKRGKACQVGAIPGVTRSIQRLYLDRNTWLLDSPGVVLSRDASSVSSILHNCIDISKVKDPIAPVESILKRCNKEQMMMRYLIKDYSNVQEFVLLIAKRLGLLNKSGIPDADKAARHILHQWNVGHIRYYTHPPTVSNNPSHEKSEIVKEMSKPFDMDSVLKNEQSDLSLLKNMPSKHVSLVSDVTNSDDQHIDDGEDMNDEDDDDEEKDDDNEAMDVAEEEMTVELPMRKDKGQIAEQKMKKDIDSVLPGNQQTNKVIKKKYKKMRKERKRTDVVAESLSQAMESALEAPFEASEPYNFNEDFHL